MDADYQRNALAPDQHHFEQSLFVLATVMSAPARGPRGRRRRTEGVRVRLGSARSSTARAGSTYAKASDEHGVRRRRAGRIAAAHRRSPVARSRPLRPDRQPLRLDRRRSRQRASNACGRSRRAARSPESGTSVTPRRPPNPSRTSGSGRSPCHCGKLQHNEGSYHDVRLRKGCAGRGSGRRGDPEGPRPRRRVDAGRGHVPTPGPWGRCTRIRTNS